MATVTALGYISIGVKDIAAWEDYATNFLGLEVSGREEDGSLLLRMDDYHYRFIIHPSGEDDLILAGWEVKDERALKELAEKIRAAGIEVEEGNQELAQARHVLDVIRFTDPDGLETEIFYGPFINNNNPFKSPRAISGFETGEAGSMGLGHILTVIKDREATTDFYVNVLGLKISDYIDLGPDGRRMRATFLHANPRHHSLAFVAMEHAPKRLNHFMIETKDMDDVGITFALAKEKGIPTGELGRHTNDRMFSFYHITPSGFSVEYGYGGRLVDDTDWQVQYYRAPSIWGHGQPRPVAESAAS